MKPNKLKFLCAISVLTIISALSGCSKIQEEINVKSNGGFEAKIRTWLKNQNQITNHFRKQKLKSLEDNLNFTLSWEEVYHNNKVLVVPINESLKFKNNRNENSTNYFVSFINREDKIIFSLIIQVRGNVNKNKVELNQGDVLKIYSSESIGKQVNIRFITLFDNYLYEKEFSQNKIIFQKHLDSKISNSGTRNSINNLESTGCIDWYLVTTWSDGSQTEVFLYQTCPNGGGGACYDSEDASICPPGDGGNYGGDSDYDNYVDSVIINLTDSCLLNLVTRITTSNIASLVGNMFNTTFVGTNAPASISFSQNSNLVNPTTGLPLVALSTPNPITHTWQVQLNNSMYPSASSEFWGSVIVHELTHSFMTLYFGSNPNFQTLTGQHQQMFTSEINNMSSFLVSHFGLTTINANALALGGIGDYLSNLTNNINPVYFAQANLFVEQNYGLSFTGAEAIRDLYKDGTLGEICN